MSSLLMSPFPPSPPPPTGFNDPYSPYGNTRAFLDYGIMGFRECATEIAHFLSNLEGVDVKEPLKLRMIGHLENMVAQKELAINAAMAANSQVGVAAAAAATSSKLPAPAAGPQPATLQTVVSLPSVSIPYAPLTPPRASPDNLSPPASFPVAEPLPRFSVAFPMPTTPIISLAPTNGTMPAVFHPAPSGFKPVLSAAAVVQQQQPSAPTSVVKPAPTLAPLPRPPAARPLTVITSTAMTSGTTDQTFGPLTPPLDKNVTAGRLEGNMASSALSPTKTPTNSTKAPFRPWADSIDVTNA